MRIALLRFLPECKTRVQTGQLLGTSSVLIICAGTLLTFGLLFIPGSLHFTSMRSDVLRLVLFLTGVAALSQSLVQHLLSYYRAYQRALAFTMLGLLDAGLVLFANLAALWLMKSGIVGLVGSMALAHTITLGIVAIDVLRVTGFGINLRAAPELLCFGLPLVFSMVAELVLGAAGIYFLGYYRGLEEVAIYSMGLKFASVLSMVVVMPFSLAFQPYVYSNLSDRLISKKVGAVLTCLVFVTAFGAGCLAASSKILIAISSTADYKAASRVIVLLLPGFTFTSLMRFGEALLAGAKKTVAVSTISLAAAATAAVLNWLLVPSLGLKGSVAASDLAYSLAGLAMAIAGASLFKVRIELRPLSFLATACVLILGAAFFLEKTSWIAYHFTMALFLVGFLAIAGGTAIFGDDVKAMVGTLFYGLLKRCGIPSGGEHEAV